VNNIILNQLEFLLQVYEPVEEGSYIKMIDMVKGEGGQLQVTNMIFLFIRPGYLVRPNRSVRCFGLFGISVV
jgi:hypothetical protein